LPINVSFVGSAQHFTIPAGQYYFTMQMSLKATSTLVQLPVFLSTNGIVLNYLSGGAPGNAFPTDNYCVTYSVDAPTSGDVIVDGTALPSNFTANDILVNYVLFSTTYLGLPLLPLNEGLTLSYRPVAMSVLVTSELNELNDGGMVAIALLEKGAFANYITSEIPSGNKQFQYYEGLSQVNPDGGNTYDGKLRDGAYCYWSPEGPTDFEFHDPATQNGSDLPVIAFAGSVIPNAPGVAGSSILVARLQVVRVFEILTESNLLDTEICFGSQKTIDDALRTIQLLPHAMQNKEHIPFFNRVRAMLASLFKGSVSFVNNNRDWLVPLGNAALGGLAAL